MRGAIDIEDGRPSPGNEGKLAFDRGGASKYGVSIRDLGPYVQLVTDGVRIGSYRPDDAPDELRIVTRAGLIPVSNFATRRVEPKVGNITRRNRVYAMAAAARPAARPVARQPVSR